jgi:hypothetical protein
MRWRFSSTTYATAAEVRADDAELEAMIETAELLHFAFGPTKGARGRVEDGDRVLCLSPHLRLAALR